MATEAAGKVRAVRFKHILLADDGSAAAGAARAFALNQATSNQAKLTVVYVRDPEQTSESAKAKLAPTLAAAAAAGLECKSVFGSPVGITNPGRRIIDAAEKCGADMVVVGARGSGRARKILGSVSSYVVTQARISVCVIR